MLNQLIPFLFMSALLLINLRRRRWSHLSTQYLLYISVCCLLSVFLYSSPRTGDPYSTTEAMLYLGVGFTLMLLPLFRLQDSNEDNLRFVSFDDRTFCAYALALAVITVPAALYFLRDGISAFSTFANSGLDREAYRKTLDLASRDKGLVVMWFYLAMLFSKCALFVGVVGLVAGRHFTLSLALMFGSLALVLKNFQRLARVDMLGHLVFLLIILQFASLYVGEPTRRRIRKFVLCVMLLGSIPFLGITVMRFDGEVLYSLYSYLATGPYSFNADYAFVRDYGWSSSGDLCLPMLREFAVKAFGDGQYENKMLEFYDDDTGPYAEYMEISGASRSEFKTCVGSFMFDFGRWQTLVMLFVMSCLICRIFSCEKRGLFALFISALYVFIVFNMPFGWPFTTHQLSVEFMILVVFSLMLRRFPFVRIDKEHHEKG